MRYQMSNGFIFDSYLCLFFSLKFLFLALAIVVWQLRCIDIDDIGL